MTPTPNGASSATVEPSTSRTAWAFPSETFPAWPRVALAAPHGWEPVAAPDAVIALRAVEPAPGGFRTNVVVTVTRCCAGYTLARAVVDLETRIAGLPEPREIDGREVGLGEHRGHLREVAFTDPRAGTVRQGHLLVILDRGRVHDLVHATGSCADDAPDEVEAMRSAVTSIRLVGP